MFYIVGDIHGQYRKLKSLFDILEGEIMPEDTVIFVGDYIDRGPSSYMVISFLIELSGRYRTVFIKGNHEQMFLDYYSRGVNYDLYVRNGGIATIRSYIKKFGAFTLPDEHIDFFNRLVSYYEGDDFIAVHAGLNPDVESINSQSAFDLIWIREDFFNAPKRWGKTVIFGHTPTPLLHGSDTVYFDEKRNIIGIDTYAMVDDFPLTCLRWPDRKIYRSL